MKWKTFIYKITNTINGSCYVGVSRHLYRRFAQHQKAKSHIGEAIRKYGVHSFELSIIFVGDDAKCYEIEPLLIAEHVAKYNVTHGPAQRRQRVAGFNVPFDTADRGDAIDMHPGQFIRETLLPEYGLNVSAGAKAIGMDRASFHKVLSGQSPVTNDLAYKLAALMRDEVADLLILWQQRWTLEQERPKRLAYRDTIARLEPVAS